MKLTKEQCDIKNQQSRKFNKRVTVPELEKFFMKQYALDHGFMGL